MRRKGRSTVGSKGEEREDLGPEGEEREDLLSVQKGKKGKI